MTVVANPPIRVGSSASKKANTLKKYWLGYGLLLLLGLGVLAFGIFQPIQVLPRISLSPGYALIDQNGKRLTNEDLRGHLVLYNFTYTACASPCTQSMETMHTVQQQMAQINTRGLPVDLVTIAFDPAHDTTAQLQAFASKVEADTQHWHFVSGEPAHLKNVIGGGFGVYYNRNPDGSFTFEPMFVLVDGVGIIRAKYHTAALDPALIQRDLQFMATEARNSQGAARVAYEAAPHFLS
jgi:protein SCO1/2